MRTTLTLTILLISVTFAAGKNTKRDVILKNDTEALPEANFTGIDYHFVLKLIYTISEEKAPAHLIKIIYTAPEANGIKAEDIINFFSLPQLTIQKTLEVLETINVPASSLFSINSLDILLKELNWKFTEFYNSIITNIAASGIPVKNALDALGIDSGRFSGGIAYGEPDPYVEFKKGNFTYDNVENATVQLNITLDQLFGIVANNSLKKLINLNASQVIKIFENSGVNQTQALAIWKNQNMTLKSISNITNLRNYLSAIDAELRAQTTLGVAISNDTIAINKAIYNTWKNRTYLIDIVATALTTPLNALVDLSKVLEAAHTNIVTLKTDSILHSLPIAKSEVNLTNCTLVTLAKNETNLNETLVLVNVNVTNHGDILELPRNATNNIILGTPLICDNHIYGILREVNAESIVLDSFSRYFDETKSAGFKVLPMISVLLTIVIGLRAL